jgi:hypothetical protein
MSRPFAHAARADEVLAQELLVAAVAQLVGRRRLGTAAAGSATAWPPRDVDHFHSFR